MARTRAAESEAEPVDVGSAVPTAVVVPSEEAPDTRADVAQLLAALATPKGQEVVDLAAGLFFDKGYDATGLAEVASVVGILKGSLYHYIGSKDDLLFAIIDKVHRTSLTNMIDWQPTDGNVYLKLRMFIKGHVTHFAENFIFGAVFMHDFRSLSSGRREVIVAERDVYEGYLRTLIRQGQSEGMICPDLDVKLVSMGIFGMMNWMYRWYRPGGSVTPAALGDQFADMVLGGLACEASQHRSGHKRVLGSPTISEHKSDDTQFNDHDVDLNQVLAAAQRAATRSSPAPSALGTSPFIEGRSSRRSH